MLSFRKSEACSRGMIFVFGKASMNARGPHAV